MIKFKFTIIFSFAAVLSILSCNSNQSKTTATERVIDTASVMLRGDSIATGVQKILLSNVILAMKSGGPVYAVSFCNEQAMPLTDSLAKAYNCRIQRVSDKYRNPTNKLSETDLEIWTKMSLSAPMSPIVSTEKSHIVYYKPITIAMPACLKCHGSAGKEIDTQTLEIIRKKYPEDQATGYKEGDLRGMWKIIFL